MMLNFKKKSEHKKIIEEANFFDAQYYLKEYSEARRSTSPAIEHFLKEGLAKGYCPNDAFDPIWYAKYYTHVKKSNLSSVLHFLTIGRDENYFQSRKEMAYYTLIKKSNLFESDFYEATYTHEQRDKENVDWLLDYVRHGEKEGKNPNATFDATQYYDKYKNEIIKLDISPFEHYLLYWDEINRLLLKAKENMAEPFEKNDFNIVALLPEGIENENRASMLRVVAPLTLDMVKKKIFFKALPFNFDVYELSTYDSCIVYANSIREQEKAESLIALLKQKKIELIVYVEKEESSDLDEIIGYLLDHANVALFSTQTLIARYPSKVKRAFLLPAISEIELLNKNTLEFLAVTWLQSIQKINTIVDNSDFFDRKFYIDENIDLKRKSINPLWHYFWYGWREKRVPSSRFDIFWYAEAYCQAYPLAVNPILHYELIGKNRGYEIRPKYSGLHKRVSLLTNPKRIALFAGYDKDGIIDDYVILFMKELSKYSDIYFLTDSIVSQKELDKLTPYTKGAWAYRHGEYDFGSYKRLAQYHVGWEEIEQYDELLFVNDSSYLISSLEDVFLKMNAKETSFWGVQATKGIKSTKDKETNQFSSKIPMHQIKKEYLKDYFKEDKFDFLLGSYFLAFRSNIIKDKTFQQFVNNISKERNKVTIILRNEIGLTKFLIVNEYDFETYMDDLYPYHPVYSNVVYDMIQDGFPFFKRLFIVLNHYKTKKLYDWKDRLRILSPRVDLKMIEENIIRVGSATAIYKNLDVEKNDEKLFDAKAFMAEEKIATIEEKLWIFMVDAKTHTLNEQTQKRIEEIKNNELLEIIVLYRSKPVEIEGLNIKCLPLYSKEGQRSLLKSSKIFVGHLLNLEVPFPLDINKHEFIDINNR